MLADRGRNRRHAQPQHAAQHTDPYQPVEEVPSVKVEAGEAVGQGPSPGADLLLEEMPDFEEQERLQPH